MEANDKITVKDLLDSNEISESLKLKTKFFIKNPPSEAIKLRVIESFISNCEKWRSKFELYLLEYRDYKTKLEGIFGLEIKKENRERYKCPKCNEAIYNRLDIDTSFLVGNCKNNHTPLFYEPRLTGPGSQTLKNSDHDNLPCSYVHKSVTHVLWQQKKVSEIMIPSTPKPPKKPDRPFGLMTEVHYSKYSIIYLLLLVMVIILGVVYLI